MNKQELMEKLQDEASFIGCETYSDYAEEIWPLIQSAILAEREACAIMAQHWGAMMNDADPRETLPAAEFDKRYGHSDLPDAIRARSNLAPESPKEAVESRKITFAGIQPS